MTENATVTIKNFSDGTEKKIPVELCGVTLEYRSLDATAREDERFIKFYVTPEEAISLLSGIVKEKGIKS